MLTKFIDYTKQYWTALGRKENTDTQTFMLFMVPIVIIGTLIGSAVGVFIFVKHNPLLVVLALFLVIFRKQICQALADYLSK